MKIVVTGGAGFIGSALIEHLNEIGIREIVVVDELGFKSKWKNLVGLDYQEYYEKDDFLKYFEKFHAISGITHVVHLGACSNTQEKDASYLVKNNVDYSKRMIDICASRDIRFIYASSAATYGNGSCCEMQPLTDLKPINMYGYSKHMLDMYVRKYYRGYATGLKFFNVFGPREEHKGIMKSFILSSFEKLTGGYDSLDIYETGGSLRDFIYIDDVVKVITHFIKGYGLGIYNVGSGISISWKYLAEVIFKVMGKDSKINTIGMPERMVAAYQYSTHSTNERLRESGYDAPMTIIDDAVKMYYDKWRTNR
jgi:ADP-L-glycero-D-manno-heptose 6-epimerase